MRQVRAEHERDLRLDLRLEEPPGRDGAAVGDGHVGEEGAEVRLPDAELRLHGGGGQPDLASGDTASRGQAALDVDALNAVRGVDVALGEQGPYGWDRARPYARQPAARRPPSSPLRCS
ncbi:hypothetical protein GCM10010129_69210 [Streptomyces fumigatiscleroticus]|nr:hypothetical protein GCM10010129_69210 [Streptomyces fumigatiscleroticus]